MYDMPQVVARNLRRVRHARGLSQEEVAHRAEIDRTYVSALERAKYNPTVDMVGRLALVLGVTPASLLELPKKGNNVTRGPRRRRAVKTLNATRARVRIAQ
jgi:transcriptional regulator with XRE-family HTH domain